MLNQPQGSPDLLHLGRYHENFSNARPFKAYTFPRGPGHPQAESKSKKGQLSLSTKAANNPQLGPGWYRVGRNLPMPISDIPLMTSGQAAQSGLGGQHHDDESGSNKEDGDENDNNMHIEDGGGGLGGGSGGNNNGNSGGNKKSGGSQHHGHGHGPKKWLPQVICGPASAQGEYYLSTMSHCSVDPVYTVPKDSRFMKNGVIKGLGFNSGSTKLGPGQYPVEKLKMNVAVKLDGGSAFSRATEDPSEVRARSCATSVPPPGTYTIRGIFDYSDSEEEDDYKKNKGHGKGKNAKGKGKGKGGKEGGKGKGKGSKGSSSETKTGSSDSTGPNQNQDSSNTNNLDANNESSDNLNNNNKSNINLNDNTSNLHGGPSASDINMSTENVPGDAADSGKSQFKGQVNNNGSQGVV